MGKSQREKGMRGERELFGLLSAELGFVVQRNVDQARSGGADGMDIPGFAVECKRCEALSRPKWWRQAVEQGQAVKREPILFYRRNDTPWRAMLYRHDADPVDVPFDAAVRHVREKLAYQGITDGPQT
jgi:hypothetical protein